MAKQEIFFGINIDTGQSIRTFGELKKRTKELKKELDGLEVGSDRFESLQKEILRNQKTITAFNRELRGSKSLAENVAIGVSKALDSFDKIENGTKEFSILSNEIKKVEKNTESLQAQLLKTEKGTKEFEKLQEEIRQNQRTIDKFNSKLQASEENVKRLEQRTSELQQELKNTRKGTEAFDRLEKEIKQNQLTISKFNKELEQTNRGVNSIDSKLSAFQKTGQKLSNTFKRVGGVIAGAFAVNAIIDFTKQAINTIKDFEQQIAIVGAVSGASKKELELLAKSARDLGKTSLFTATEVAQLQEELAKLGFTTQEIISASGGILDLATAFKLDLAEAAETTASTLNAFGLEADDTRMVVDVMADSFSSSALNLTRFQEAIKLVAPAAKQTGRTLQETTALLSLLADNGISGSIAGTQLNRVFIELNKKGLSLERAMELVATSTNKLGTATELVGDRGAKALSIFADQSTALEKLREDYADVTGEAEQLALKTGDTLEGSLKRAKSAWDELILSFSGSKGVLRDTVDAFTGFISELTESSSLIGRAEEFGLFKDELVIIDAVEAVQAKTTESLSDNQKTLRNLIQEDKKFQDQIAKAISENNLDLLRDLGKEAVANLKSINKTGRTELDITGDQAMAFFNLYKQSFEDIKDAFKQVKQAKKEAELDLGGDGETKKEAELDLGGDGETKNPTRGLVNIDPKDSAIVDFNRQVNEELANLGEERIEKAKEVSDSEFEIQKKNRLRQLALEQEVADTRTYIASGLLNSTIEFLSRDEKARQKNAKIIKAIAISDVLVNLQRQIAYNNLNSASPLFPANLFTGGLAGVTIAQGLNALAIAQAGASIGTISAQKFQRGGIIQGKSHAEGGVPIMARGGQIEAEGGEAIINKKNTKMFAPILSAINSYGGNGDKFERGGIINNGLPNTVTPPSTTQSDILTRLDSIEFKPTVSVVEINEAQTRIAEIENNSTL